MTHTTEEDQESRSSTIVRRFAVVGSSIVLLVMAVGVATTVADGSGGTDSGEDASSALIQVTPSDAPTTPDKSETVAPMATQLPNVLIAPRCWSERRSAEDDNCQVAVRDKTKFISRYMTNQKSLAAKHPAVRLAPTGRQANSLARHGLLVCWLVKEPKYSLDDIRSAFYLWFHQHKFTVPNDDTDAAADNVINIAVQEICPRLAETLERKGGPKAELINPAP